MNDPGLWSRGNLQAVPTCPACGGARRAKPVFARRDNELGMPDVWQIVCCADCGSLWLDPRPDEQSLPRAYKEYYTHGAECEDVPDRGIGGFAWQLIHGYLNRRFGMHRAPADTLGYPILSLIEPWRLKLDYYGRHLTRRSFRTPGTLLDIGCGNGAFLARAKEMGWTVAGCDPDAKAVAMCRQLNLDVIQGDAFAVSLDGQRFDVVTLSHVIEHVSEPLVLVRRIHELLRPRGVLWMALPNPQSIGLHVFGSGWHALHPPYHLCIPSRDIVRGWLERSGFVHIKFLRRGAHARVAWRLSTRIGVRQSLPRSSALEVAFLRYIADALATVGTRRAEETVVVAHRDGSSV